MPWLPLTDPPPRSVAAQARRDDSLLALYRRLIALRARARGEFELLDAGGRGVLAYRRGEHVVAINLGDEPAGAAGRGERARDRWPTASPKARPPGDRDWASLSRRV